MTRRRNLSQPTRPPQWTRPLRRGTVPTWITASAAAQSMAARIRTLRRGAGALLTAGMLATGFVAQSAHAIPVSYTGDLGSGGSATNAVAPDSGPFGNAD